MLGLSLAATAALGVKGAPHCGCPQPHLSQGLPPSRARGPGPRKRRGQRSLAGVHSACWERPSSSLPPARELRPRTSKPVCKGLWRPRLPVAQVTPDCPLSAAGQNPRGWNRGRSPHTTKQCPERPAPGAARRPVLRLPHRVGLTLRGPGSLVSQARAQPAPGFPGPPVTNRDFPKGSPPGPGTMAPNHHPQKPRRVTVPKSATPWSLKCSEMLPPGDQVCGPPARTAEPWSPPVHRERQEHLAALGRWPKDAGPAAGSLWVQPREGLQPPGAPPFAGGGACA